MALKFDYYNPSFYNFCVKRRKEVALCAEANFSGGVTKLQSDMAKNNTTKFALF